MSHPYRKKKFHSNPHPQHFVIYVYEYQRVEQKKNNELMTMKDAYTKGADAWKLLPESEKDRYIAIAKSKTWKERKNKYLGHGMTFPELEELERQRLEYEWNMKKDVTALITKAKNDDCVAEQKHHFINANYFVQTKDVFETYIPAEIALSEFCLRDGITNKYHSFVNPGVLPFGHALQAQEHARSTHQLKLPPHAIGEKNLGKLYMDIVKFISPVDYKFNNYGENIILPPVYTDAKNLSIIKSVLKFCKDDCFEDNVPEVLVYPMQFLFYKMKVATADIGEVDKPRSMEETDEKLSLDLFEYQTGISCEHHESLDRGRFCPLSCVTRWGFIFAENMCPDLAIQLVPGQHKPAGADFIFVTSENEHEFRKSQITDDINYIINNAAKIKEEIKKSMQMETPTVYEHNSYFSNRCMMPIDNNIIPNNHLMINDIKPTTVDITQIAQRGNTVCYENGKTYRYGIECEQYKRTPSPHYNEIKVEPDIEDEDLQRVKSFNEIIDSDSDVQSVKSLNQSVVSLDSDSSDAILNKSDSPSKTKNKEDSNNKNFEKNESLILEILRTSQKNIKKEKNNSSATNVSDDDKIPNSYKLSKQSRSRSLNRRRSLRSNSRERSRSRNRNSRSRRSRSRDIRRRSRSRSIHSRFRHRSNRRSRSRSRRSISRRRRSRSRRSRSNSDRSISRKRRSISRRHSRSRRSSSRNRKIRLGIIKREKKSRSISRPRSVSRSKRLSKSKSASPSRTRRHQRIKKERETKSKSKSKSKSVSPSRIRRHQRIKKERETKSKSKSKSVSPSRIRRHRRIKKERETESKSVSPSRIRRHHRIKRERKTRSRSRSPSTRKNRIPKIEPRSRSRSPKSHRRPTTHPHEVISYTIVRDDYGYYYRRPNTEPIPSTSATVKYYDPYSDPYFPYPLEPTVGYPTPHPSTSIPGYTTNPYVYVRKEKE